jgi:alpha-beta hydrolase superfamily lysophospholipase
MCSEEGRMEPSPRQPGELPGPHAGQPILTAGPPPENAACTLVLVHGRGASAEDILALAEELRVEGLAALAPRAAGQSWYPYSFLAPLAANQPYLDSALRRLESIVAAERPRLEKILPRLRAPEWHMAARPA